MDGTAAAHAENMRLRGLSGRTIGLRLMVLRLLVAHAGRPLLDLTTEDLDAWQRSLLDRDVSLEPESRRAYVVQVRGYYRWAVEAGLRADNPAAVLIVPKVPKGLPRPMTEVDLELALARAPLRIRVWIELAGYGGARAMEVAALERRDILDQLDAPAVVLHGKGGKTRTVPLASSTLADLYTLGMPARGRIFRRESGQPVSSRYVYSLVNEFLHSLGIDSTMHSLRHRFATRMYPATGHNLRQLQELLGHDSPATTAIYTLVDPSAAAPAVEAIARPLLRPTREEDTA